MTMSQTIACEGLLANGIPVGEIEQFLNTVTAAGSGVHQPVVISIDKVKGGDDVVRLSVDLSSDTEIEAAPEPAE